MAWYDSIKNNREKLEGLVEILAEQNPEIKLESVKDKDGNLFNVDEFKIGGMVSMVSTDGTMIPCKKGEYVFDNGKHVQVDDNGLIVSMLDDVANTDVPAENVQKINNSGGGSENSVPGQQIPSKDVTDQQPFPEERIKKIEDNIDMINSRMEEVMGLMTQLTDQAVAGKEYKKTAEKDKKELSKQIEMLKRTPVAEPINLSAVEVINNEVNLNEKSNKIQELTNQLKKVRAGQGTSSTGSKQLFNPSMILG